MPTSHDYEHANVNITEMISSLAKIEQIVLDSKKKIDAIDLSLNGNGNGTKGLIRRTDNIESRLDLVESADKSWKKHLYGFTMIIVTAVLTALSLKYIK